MGDEGVADACENVSGIVCVAHTEGGEDRTPNNLDLLLRTLSGFMVNPNVGAVLSSTTAARRPSPTRCSAPTWRITATP